MLTGTWDPGCAAAFREIGVDGEGWTKAVGKFEEGTPSSACLFVNLGRIADPFWCLPGLFWGDNLQDSSEMLYPRFDREARVPSRFRSRRWLVSSSRISLPLVAVHSEGWWSGLEVDPLPLSTPGGEEPPRFSLGFDWNEERTLLLLRIPESDEPYTNSGCEHTQATEERLAGVGDVFVRYRIFRQQGTRDSLRERLRSRYVALSGSRARNDPPACPAEVAAATAHALTRWHFSQENQVFKYSVAYDRIGQQIAETAGCTLDSVQFFVGWAGGWGILEPLYDYAKQTGETVAFETATATWQKVSAGLTSPCGLWWSRYAPEFIAHSGEPKKTIFRSRLEGDYDGGWMEDPHHLHLRTLGDAVLRAARSLRKHGAEMPFAAQLRSQLLMQAELVAAKVSPGGMIPLAVDARTGEPTSLKGSAGMIWLSVWLELARQGLWEWSDTALIDRAAAVAREAVRSGFLYGACEDGGECMTSEDVYIAINVFCDLYEAFGRNEDLETAVAAASWLPFYRRAFALAPSRRTVLGVYGLCGAGGDIASVKNTHFHIYGLDAEASLRRLTEWTSDETWSLMADDHWRYALQCVCLEDGHFNGYRGFVPEQLYFFDWACLGNSVHRREADRVRTAWKVDEPYRNRGNLSGFSTAWCVAFVLAGALRRMEGSPILHNRGNRGALRIKHVP